MFRGLMSLSDKVIHDIAARFDITADARPGSRDALLLRGDTESVLFLLENDLVSWPYSEGLSHGCRDDDAAIFADAKLDFLSWHGYFT
jgi:hypothetical protein